MTLPASGRAGDAPEWPLSRPSVLVDGETVVLEEVQTRETAMWSEEWRRPQALMWERNGQAREVAMYVRSFVAAEDSGAAVNLRTLVRQQQESLGLSLPGLARNHWRIEQVASGPSAVVTPMKSPFKVVKGGAA